MANVFIRPSDSSQSVTIIDADTSFTLDREDCPCTIHNASATGAVVVTLPIDIKGGEQVTLSGMVAQTLRVEPQGRIWATDGTTFAKQADTKYLGAAGLGENVLLTAIANDGTDNVWLATAQSDMAQAASIGFIAVEA